jgi:Phosphotransferase enzyme family
VPGEEERLPGGSLNGAVRIGDTVRRSAGPWTPNVHALLNHLREAGFNYAPRPLGIDDKGREVLEYIAGDTVGGAYPWPEWVWSESLLAEVGTAIAELHVAVADFRPPETATWQFATGSPGAGEIVGHFDLAPYNVVVREGRLAAFIDWDLARPLRALDELAFVAWEWVPFWHPDSARGLGWRSPPDLKRRLEILLRHYGAEARRGFLERVIASVDLRAEEITLHAGEGVPGYVRLVAEGQVANIAKTGEYLRRNRDQLQEMLDL